MFDIPRVLGLFVLRNVVTNSTGRLIRLDDKDIAELTKYHDTPTGRDINPAIVYVVALIIANSSYDYYVQEDFKRLMANGETDIVSYIIKLIVDSPDLKSNFRGGNVYNTVLQGSIEGWLNLYLQLVETSGDTSSVKTYLCKIFAYHGGDIEVYHKLKAMVALTEWKPLIYNLIKYKERALAI